MAHSHMIDHLRRIVRVCFSRGRRKGSHKNIYMNGKALCLKAKQEKKTGKTYRNSRDVLDHARFTQCRNQLWSLMRRLRRELEENLPRNIKTKPKAFWQYSNTRLKTKSKLDDFRDETRLTVSDNSRKAELLKAFFSSIFTNETTVQIPEPTTQFSGPGLEPITITAELVLQKLTNLKNDSAPGPNSLHPKLLQLATWSLAEALVSLFNESLDQGSSLIRGKWQWWSPSTEGQQAGTRKLQTHQPYMHPV